MLKKVLRIFFYFLISLVGIFTLGFLGLKLAYNEDLPNGETGKVADEVACQMLKAIKHEEFTQAKEIRWTFRGINYYVWKMQDNLVDVYWKDYQVKLQTKTQEESKVYYKGNQIEGEKRNDAIAYANKNFNNDSFWLIAPHKVFDEGVERQIIKDNNGQQKLLVTYTTGGNTPGDSYLWELDKNHKPVSMKMWVSIIPFDGVEAKWVDWQMTAGGFPLPNKRTFFGIEIPISEVEVLPH